MTDFRCHKSAFIKFMYPQFFCLKKESKKPCECLTRLHSHADEEHLLHFLTYVSSPHQVVRYMTYWMETILGCMFAQSSETQFQCYLQPTQLSFSSGNFISLGSFDSGCGVLKPPCGWKIKILKK